jgi:serine/threonine protein kinase
MDADGPPADALRVAEQRCGPVVLQEITSRRGAVAWRAVGPAGAVAIKAGTSPDGKQITDREAEVLLRLSGHEISRGQGWLVTSWLAGPSTWDLFRTTREEGHGKDAALAAAVALCHAVARLHFSGWVHADIQPDHGIHHAAGVRLLDFSWAWSVWYDQSPLYKGGIDHLIAPELAAAIEASSRPVRPSPAADIYALAGTLWTCATGAWPLDYSAVGLSADEAQPEELRRVIATGTVPLLPATPWPVLQDVLRPVLLANAEDRPTAAVLAAMLEALQSRHTARQNGQRFSPGALEWGRLARP